MCIPKTLGTIFQNVKIKKERKLLTCLTVSQWIIESSKIQKINILKEYRKYIRIRFFFLFISIPSSHTLHRTSCSSYEIYVADFQRIKVMILLYNRKKCQKTKNNMINYNLYWFLWCIRIHMFYNIQAKNTRI